MIVKMWLKGVMGIAVVHKSDIREEVTPPKMNIE
jgi:hypothetical protein